jgi:hypothetical protein
MNLIRLTLLTIFFITQFKCTSQISLKLDIENPKIFSLDYLLFKFRINNNSTNKTKITTSSDLSQSIIAEYCKKGENNWKRINITELHYYSTALFSSDRSSFIIKAKSQKNYNFSSLLKYNSPGQYLLRVKLIHFDGRKIFSPMVPFKVIKPKGKNKKALSFLLKNVDPLSLYNWGEGYGFDATSEDFITNFMNLFPNTKYTPWVNIYHGNFLLHGLRSKYGPLFEPDYEKIKNIASKIKKSKKNNRFLVKEANNLINDIVWVKKIVEWFKERDKKN